jgi:hypothetical protein
MRLAVIVAAIVAVIAAAGVLFGRPHYQQWKARRAELAAASAGLRLAVLNREFLDTTVASDPDAIRCVVMDWNIGGESVATLVAFDEGTTSLYFSFGGGVLGAGEHAKVRAAATQFRATAASVRDHFRPVETFERPPSGHSRFFLVTRTGTFASPIISNDELQQEGHPFARLGEAAQATITEVRRTT